LEAGEVECLRILTSEKGNRAKLQCLLYVVAKGGKKRSQGGAISRASQVRRLEKGVTSRRRKRKGESVIQILTNKKQSRCVEEKNHSVLLKKERHGTSVQRKRAGNRNRNSKRWRRVHFEKTLMGGAGQRGVKVVGRQNTQDKDPKCVAGISGKEKKGKSIPKPMTRDTKVCARGKRKRAATGIV